MPQHGVDAWCEGPRRREIAGETDIDEMVVDQEHRLRLQWAASMDWTGGYTYALIGSGALCLACGAAALIVERPVPPRLASKPN